MRDSPTCAAVAELGIIAAFWNCLCEWCSVSCVKPRGLVHGRRERGGNNIGCSI